MTKQYKYIEHENIIDVAKTIHDEQHIFQKRGDDYFMVNIWADGIFPDHQYYKRVEIKEKTVEAWAIIDRYGVTKYISNEYMKIESKLEHLLSRKGEREYAPFSVIILTGTIKD